jgi:hypothetical protein
VARDRDHARRDRGQRHDGDARVAFVDREARHHGVPEPGRDQALDDRVVVRPESPVGLGALPAEGRLDARDGVRRAEADQRRGGDLLQRRGAAGERRARLRDEDVGIAHELGRLERRLFEWELDEPDVDLAPLDGGADAFVVELCERHLDLRPLRREAQHDLRQHACADGLERADAQRADLARAQRVQVGLRGLQPRDDRLGVP